jgi:autotransporter strand-loop-strand O-heptosyltransferase
MAEVLIPLLRDAYPEINFVTHEQVDPKHYYATCNIGLFFDDEKRIHQPCDFRLVGLHRTAGYILGVHPAEEPPRIVPSSSDRPIPERYVCIATQSTTQGKYWNNPFGWREVISFLKAEGYEVVCTDRAAVSGHGVDMESPNHLPHGARDDWQPAIQERARGLGARGMPELEQLNALADRLIGYSRRNTHRGGFVRDPELWPTTIRRCRCRGSCRPRSTACASI